MRKLSFVLFAVILVAACNNSGGWSAAEKQSSLKTCMNEVAGKVDDATAKKYCSCVLEKMMQKYPTYAQADKTGTEEDGQKIGQACAAEIQKADNGGTKKGGILGGLGGTDNSGWSDADKQKFMNTCLQNAKNAGGDEQTSKAHCDCTLSKIEKKFSSYAEADQKMTPAEVTAMEQECNQEQNGNQNQ